MVVLLGSAELTVQPLQGALLGFDPFAYPDGDVVEVTTVPGDGWARNATVKSDWNGGAQIVGQKLVTDGTTGSRAFGDSESVAAFRGAGRYFWKVEMTYDGASEAVVASSDFGTAKIHWGVIDATGKFGIEVFDTSSSNLGVFSTAVAPVNGQKYVLAGKLDFDSDELSLWINPEAGSESTPALVVAYDGDDWSSGMMFASSADGSGVIWDDVQVGGEFTDMSFPIITPPFTLPDLTISEFMASNTLTIADPDGSSSDWIEILNVTGTAIDLAGWHLTDKASNLSKWTFPPITLNHNGRLLVWASGKDRVASAADLHTNFKLSSGDEYLALVRPDGFTVVKEYVWGQAETVTQQYSDVSYGTFGSAQSEDYFATPTPGTANIESPFSSFVGTVAISEFVATSSGVAPSSGITDIGLVGAPTFSDWVELHNPGASSLDISGCRLTDDPSRRARWRFPAGTTIPAGGYLVVLADGADMTGDYLHTNFSLSASSDYLGLFDPNGVMLDEFSPAYPQQVAGYSYGHSGYYALPTPGVANSGSPLVGIVAAPTFNIAPGFHDSPVTTTVSSPTPGATVHTEVGSAEPDQASPTTATFSSAAGQVLLVRARAYAPGMVPSRIVSASYLMDASPAEKSMPALHFIGDDYATFWDPSGGGSALGIIDNFDMRGRAWERPINLEMHFPDGTPSQELNAGLRYAGHGDRPEDFRETEVWDYKYARPQFNLFFRSEYGRSSWEHDLFAGLTDVTEHDSLRVRLDRGLVDEFIRRLWVDMGNRGSVGTLTNLYVNGILRTVVNPVQRIREPLLQEWYGTKNDFDVLAVFDFPSGEEFEYAAMEDFFEDAANDFTQLAKYQEGGERLDYENFADYMLLLSYMATTDWPENNKHAARERVPGSQFRFYVWDAQQSMADGDAPAADEATIDRLLTADDTTIKILTAVKGSEEFQLLWADRIQRHFFNGGALTDTKMDTRWFGLSAAINPIFDQYWMQSIDDNLYTSWRDTRLPHALADYKSHGLWFDDLLAPSLSQHGGPLTGASAVSLSNPTTDPQFTAMSIYYTMDGSDPRLPGGAINPAAVLAAASPLVFGAGETTLRTRVFDVTTNRWSPCNQATFQFTGSTISLVASEIFYNPPGTSEGEEFIELLNISTGESIDLSGYAFTKGISFTFPAGSVVAPGARVVVAKDPAVFASTYGMPPAGILFGPYGGSLANDGERIALSKPDGSRVIDFSYNDGSTWPQLADGNGQSLELLAPSGNPDVNAAGSWADGTQAGGSPGYVDTTDLASWLAAQGVAGDLGDLDGDGLTHLLEYAFGTDPHVAGDLPVTTASGSGGFLMIEFRRNLAAMDLTYTVEVSDDVSSWESGVTETVSLGSVRNGDGTSTEKHRCLSTIASATRRYIRVRIDTAP